MPEQEHSFGQRLRRLRLRAGLSQEALAERAGLATAAVAALERGVRRSPYPQTVGALSNALGLSAEERATMAEAARPSLQHTSAALADTAPRTADRVDRTRGRGS